MERFGENKGKVEMIHLYSNMKKIPNKKECRIQYPNSLKII